MYKIHKNIYVYIYEKDAAQILLPPMSFLRNIILESLNSACFVWGYFW